MPPVDPTWVNTVDLGLKLIAVLGAGIAFLVGLWQWRKGQRWQKGQFLLSLINSFEKNNRISMARVMLDCDKIDIPFTGNKTLHFKNDLLLSALKVVPEDKFSKDQQAIREAFDALFDFFQKLASFEKNKLLGFNDLTYFYYWFDMINHVAYYKEEGGLKKEKCVELEQMIRRYISEYRFLWVSELLDEHKRIYGKPMNLKMTRSTATVGR